MLDESQIRRMFPKALPEWMDAFARIAPALARHYKWTDHDWRHFCGQIYAETNGLSLRTMRENMRFTTASRIKEVYSYRLRLALKNDKALAREHGTVDGLARFLVGKPDLLADIVYSNREGTPAGQGHRYIGRGPTQITHLDNYRAIFVEIRKQPGGKACPDLVESPDALEQPEWGVRSAAADWQIKGLSRWANDDDLENVSSVLNAGSPGKWSTVNGKENRQRGYARAVGVWPLDETVLDKEKPYRPSESVPVAEPTLKRDDACEAVKRLQLMLDGWGYPVGDPDGCYGPLTERAVVAVQHEHGLPVTGEADQRTIEVLKRTGSEQMARKDADEQDLAERGSRTYGKAKSLTLWGRVLNALGLGGAGTGIAETISPGSVTQFVDIAPKAANALTSPAMLKLFAIGFGVGILVIGLKMASSGKQIIGFRLDDMRTGKHIGR